MAKRPRPTTALALLILLVAGTTAVGQELGESRSIPLKAEMTALFTGSTDSLYLSADPSVVWKPGRFAAGAGLELIVGMTQFDMYVNPYVRAEMARMHLDFGYVLPLIRPLGGDELTGANAGLAFFFKPFTLGYGLFGFELAFDFNLADATTVYQTATASSTAGRVILSLIGSGRVGFGVTYGFDL
jgi:hypothetical protein